jgi:hypothetical protein
MIQSILHKAVAFLLPLLIATGAVGQGVRVDASVNKNKIVIGEQIVLALSADIPESEPINFFRIDTIPHFEFIEKPAADTSNTNNGTRIYQELIITSFDSGHFVIPPFELAPGVVTDSIPIDVGYSTFNRDQPYHDIKDVLDIEVPKEPIPWWYWAIGAGGVLLLAVLIYFLTRKKSAPPPSKPVITVNAYEEAMKQMEQLQKNKPAVKEYYSAMVDIFRQYVFRRKNIQSLQKTTDDLVVQLKEINLEKNNFDQLAQALRLSDYVKFAKYQPAEADDTNFYHVIRDSIMNIENVNTLIPVKGSKKI